MCSFKPCPIHIATREFVTVGGGARGSRQGHEAARGNGGARRLAAGDRRRARRWALGFARARWAELGGVARGGSLGAALGVVGHGAGRAKLPLPRLFEADLHFEGTYEERYRFLAYGDDN
jgi:hypothetical protein